MGKVSFKCIGYGMTESEALKNAKDEARELNGYQDGYSGDINSADEIHSKCIRKPKEGKIKTIMYSQKGPRKWVTRYIVESNMHSDIYSKTQTEAIKVAKEMTKKRGVRHRVAIEKVLESGSDTVARIYHLGGEQGVWQFWGDARC